MPQLQDKSAEKSAHVLGKTASVTEYPYPCRHPLTAYHRAEGNLHPSQEVKYGLGLPPDRVPLTQVNDCCASAHDCVGVAAAIVYFVMNCRFGV